MSTSRHTSRHRSPEVVITGLGMVTPAGTDTMTSWKAVCAGLPTAAPDARLQGLPVDFSCATSGFDANRLLGTDARRMDPFSQYAVAAAREAVADAAPGDGGWDPARVGVLMGSACGGLGTWLEQAARLAEARPRPVNPLAVPKAIGNMAAASVSMDLGLHGVSLGLSTACASGASALGFALDLLRAGRCDAVLAGGTDAAVLPITSAGFDRLKALSRRRDAPSAASRPFDRERDGFVLAEGAAVLVLEHAEAARARGRRPYARLLGYGESSDAYHLTSPHPEGKGAQLAMRQALADAGVSASEVALVNAHATSTPQGDAVEARLIEHFFGSHTAVTSTKGVTGHMLGAAGAVEAAFTALSIDHGVIPPTANFETPGADVADIDIVHRTARHAPVPIAVSNAFGFGGHNAVVVLGRP
ncbi:beta-ketoacyl-[acyl-carrier-protein] synthase family protein [Streptomyces bobili]|jgi:3-oxoacyl-[acyl-carrier-protein] synthase II|uniref:beta-ketoacyl-[acyl-carrier-protein] synthase family protein n=1 Tax=Streptomyces bobili TaxID=67280 RepID=UPI00142D48CD|nr:beta-ketoacyl-[acyl-carrier-protein] synthase family protein [Streptomyces bobili]